MAHRSLFRTAAVAALALVALPAAAADPAHDNRTLDSVHAPTVSRTDFTYDVAVGPRGLAPGEAQRLAGWFDGLALGYGDTVTLAQPAWQGGRAADAVGAVLSRYGMLISADRAPDNAGYAPAGEVRVVVSRAVARVEDCPDYSRGNYADYTGATVSNFGCATARNLAAMIANPQDLVVGQQARPGGDARLSVKAVAAWRDADSTGKGGLKSVSTGGK